MAAKRETKEEKLHRLTEIERGLWDQGYAVAGIDEVGRGPLAGPVVTACVSIPRVSSSIVWRAGSGRSLPPTTRRRC